MYPPLQGRLCKLFIVQIIFTVLVLSSSCPFLAKSYFSDSIHMVRVAVPVYLLFRLFFRQSEYATFVLPDIRAGNVHHGMYAFLEFVAAHLSCFISIG